MAFDDKEDRKSSRRSPRVGNVIYVNFGAGDRDTRAKGTHAGGNRAGGTRAGGPGRPHRAAGSVGPAGSNRTSRPTGAAQGRSRSVAGRSKPAKKTRGTVADWFMQLVTAYTDAGRLRRGRDYYRAGHVVRLEFLVGSITAQVIGSQPQPFSVSIGFPPRTETKLAQLPDLISQLPGGFKDVRAGRFSPDMLKILLGEQPVKARFSCDCPDKAKVCKHIVATAWAAADQMAADPSVVFQLRGLNMADMRPPKPATQSSAQSSSPSPASTSKTPVGNAPGEWSPEDSEGPVDSATTTDRFWNGGPLPPIPQLKTQPALADSDEQLLHKAMRTISYASVDELRAVSDIEDLYYNLTHET